MDVLVDLGSHQPVAGKKVYEELKEAIVRNTIKQGVMLQERMLAEKLGVSRTPIREAFRMLSVEGLIDLIPGKGASVTRVSIEDVREIMQVREPLECVAVRLAAEKARESEIAYLEETILKWQDEASKTTDINFQSLSAYDSAFHEYIVQIANNKRLAYILSTLRDQIRRITYLTQDNKNRLDISLPQHLQILEAMKRHDPDYAEESMLAHMKSIREYYFERFGFREN